MVKIISISNHKGGVGKTTSTLNIGAGLRQQNKKVLLIDLDPQANLTQSLGILKPDFTVYGSLKGEYPLTPLEITENFYLIASSLDLSGAEIELSSEAGREFLLRELIDPLKKNYDYILIDCPPSLGLLTINALTASDQVYIPLQTQFLALQGMTKLLEIIDKIKKRLNKNLDLGGIILTQFDNRRTLDRDTIEAVQNHYQDRVFKTKIRHTVALAESPSQGKDIFRYSPNSMGALDYQDLCKEIIARL